MGTSRKKPTERPRLPARRRRLLIVEPDRLTRWSIKAYFDTLFDVGVAESAVSVYKLLAESPADAIVVADNLPNGDADAIESRARSCNESVLIVRTVTTATETGAHGARVSRLEKPFKLSSLARLLGVGTRDGGIVTDDPTDHQHPGGPSL